MSLPEVVVFSVRDSTNEDRYLSFTGPQRQLRFGPEKEVFSDTARFAVEPAKGGLVHIRSCYENHYWARASRFEPWLLASSPKKVVDMSKDECTLFRPRMSAGNVFVQFVHAQSGLNVVMRPPNDAYGYNLCVEPGVPATDFSYTDFAALSKTKLPRYVMFQGDNDRYLSAVPYNINTKRFKISFSSSVNSRQVGFEVLYDKSGDKLRIKSMSGNDLWSVVLPDTSVYTRPLPVFDPDTLFDVALSSPSSTVEQGIALRSLANNKYCRRSQQDLVAESSSPHDRSAWLRPIHLGVPNKGRVNIESFRNAWKGSKPNRNLKLHWYPFPIGSDYSVPITYLARRTTTFRNSISLIEGHLTVFNGQIPYISSTGELEFPDEATDVNASWGSTTTVEWTKTEDLKLHGNYGTTRINVFVRVDYYEVPFSYKQIDHFPFGGTETQHLHDGLLIIQSETTLGFTISPAYGPSKVELDENIYTDLRASDELQGINALEDDTEPKAFDALEDDTGPKAFDALEDDTEPKAFDALEDDTGPKAFDEVNKE